MTVTAQDEFRSLVKDHLGPRLRELGWRGSAAAWVRPHLTHWVLLGWQKGRYSTAASVDFTAHLAVMSKDAWDAENIPAGRRPRTPASGTLGWGVGWQASIGMLVPGTAGDRSWHVRPGDELAAIAGEVMRDVVTHGLPAVERELAAAAERPPVCWANVGGRNWFEACGRPAVVEHRSADRRRLRCTEHAST